MLSRHRSATCYISESNANGWTKDPAGAAGPAGRRAGAAVGLSTGGRADSVVGGCDVPIARLVARR